MKQGNFTAAAAFALLLVASPAAAQTTNARTFIMTAGASDLYERQSSQLVLNSANPSVKSFAREMISDHTDSTNKVKAAAARAHLAVGRPHLEPAQARMIGQLRAAHGSARDRLYVSQQKTAHQQALRLHQSYAAHGDTASLRAAASQIVPVVQHHVDMLNGMSGM